MTGRLATCRHQPVLTASDELVAAHLRANGVAMTTAPWDSLAPADLDEVTICLRSTWDYHTRIDEFRAWLAALGEINVTVINPADTRALEHGQGVSRLARGAWRPGIPETRWIAPGSVIDVARCCGWRTGNGPYSSRACRPPPTARTSLMSERCSMKRARAHSGERCAPAGVRVRDPVGRRDVAHVHRRRVQSRSEQASIGR